MSNNFIEDNNPSTYLIESMSRPGYSLESAIADLVDNSITAKSKNVEIYGKFEGQGSWICIEDDGDGMTEDELKLAMKIPSGDPTEIRENNDLGRFGLGLKIASFSQCKMFTVITFKGNKKFSRTWDKDHVRKTQKFQTFTIPPDNSIAKKIYENSKKDSGTIVVWEKLDKITTDWNDSERFEDLWVDNFKSIGEHLKIVFHKFLSKNLDIKINWNYDENSPTKLNPWDPYMTKHKQTLIKPDQNIEGAKITPTILPNRKNLNEDERAMLSGVRGVNNHQGFYIYRNNRLIVDGSWLGQFEPEPHYSLARIEVNIDSSMDEKWGIDVKKEKIDPSGNIRSQLKSIASRTRTEANSVYRSRAKKTSTSTHIKEKNIWNYSKNAIRSFVINIKYPTIEKFVKKLNKDEKKVFSIIKKLLERHLPYQEIIDHYNDSQSIMYEPYDDDDHEDLKKLIIFEIGYDVKEKNKNFDEAFKNFISTEHGQENREYYESIKNQIKNEVS